MKYSVPLQEEIIMEILSRLPVRSLLRFKCFSLYCSSLSSAQRIEEVQKLDCPSYGKAWRRCRLYCCYDSLALIGVFNNRDKNYLLLLWNLSGHKRSIVLPDPEFSPELCCTWGLGYESVSDDYKILKIDDKARSEILALKSGSWRLTNNYPIGNCPDLLCTESLVFVHGAFHWIDDITRSTVTVLSISSEVYTEIPLPEQMREVLGNERLTSKNLGQNCLLYKVPIFFQSCRNIGFRMVKCYSAAKIWVFVRSVLRTSKAPLELRPQSNFSQTGFLVCKQTRLTSTRVRGCQRTVIDWMWRKSCWKRQPQNRPALMRIAKHMDGEIRPIVPK
ncbi:hypothetical protein P3S67_002291 [Capsicum chacoense]